VTKEVLGDRKQHRDDSYYLIRGNDKLLSACMVRHHWKIAVRHVAYGHSDPSIARSSLTEL